MTTTAVERTASQVPALVQTPALQLTAEDVALPRIYLGQFMTKAVQEQIVKPGTIFSATSPDDPDPQVLWRLGDKKAGPVVYVIGLRKGKSITEGGELVLFDYDDPSAPADAWITYNYTFAIPAIDDQVPFKMLLTRTGKPAAQQINTVLAKNAAAGPSWIHAFELTCTERENTKGKFYVPRVKVVEAKAADVTIAEQLAVMISGSSAEVRATGDQPSI